ncbi:MAG: 2-amino-4-hydroxy-6-hydroxymethyldihydropteridine diphosphokinase, partial [Lysobacter sp.]|nr:2-amino-4-hydroxy-6-hydroxymethyldihydropteridine diphosphokinase [Lysobacter sp.]
RACVGLGGNVGDAAATLRAAFADLDRLPHTRLLRPSRLYRTPAWGVEQQPAFVNAAALLETALEARALLDGLLAIERGFGRERRERWGPRTLDLDLLLYGNAVIDEPGLHVPHPHLHERAFALRPLADVAPDLLVPGQGRVAELLSRVDASACMPLDAAS